MQRSGIFTTAISGLVGAVVGTYLTMHYSGSPATTTAVNTNTAPAQLPAAPLYSGGSDQDRIINAVRRVEPSVVALNVVVNGTQVVPADPFSQFFNGGNTGSTIRRYRARASGSGFVYRSNGLIITNAHVVGNASSVQVVFQNGDRVPAKVYAIDTDADLALIKVDGYAKLPPALELGDSSKLAQGQWAIAIGEPLELKQTVTVGVVSGFNRDETIETENGIPHSFKGLLQTSAPINPGNSGGPLIDTEGRVIGINQSTASPQYAQGIGFAIPVDQARVVVAGLEKNPGQHANIQSGFIGVQLIALDENVRQQINYLGSGVAIAGVISGSSADVAGLEPGDVIQAIDGTAVKKPEDITHIIGIKHIGDWVSLTIWTSGSKQTVRVKIGNRPNEAEEQSPQ